MKIMILAVIALTWLGAMTTPIDENTGIRFHSGSWDEALEKAKQEHKLVFLDISASWCGPCRQLKKKTFPDTRVGDFYNNHFVNVALDGEVGEGKALAQQFRVRGYPTMIFVDEQGHLMARVEGYRNPTAFLKLGQSVVEKYEGQ